MMNQNGLFRIGFVDELKAQILELPYTKGKLDMVVLLPSGSADNLKALEEVSLHLHISAAAVHGGAKSLTQLSDSATMTTAYFGAPLLAQMVENPPAMQETQVQFLGREDPLQKGMAPHSSTLAWRIPWMEEPGGVQSIGLQVIGHD